MFCTEDNAYFSCDMSRRAAIFGALTSPALLVASIIKHRHNDYSTILDSALKSSAKQPGKDQPCNGTSLISIYDIQSAELYLVKLVEHVRSLVTPQRGQVSMLVQAAALPL